MTPERWEAVKRLFNDALERQPSERAAYVAEAAKTDPALAEEVRALLSGQGRADEAFSALARTAGLKTLAAGTRLGPYEIVSLVGTGGMGEVYKARDTRLDRTVAVKVLPADVAADAGLRTRFEREARTISSLSHPHICALYDVGEQDGRSFLVMEYLEGDTLTDRLTKGPLPLDQALRHATEIAEALAEAHQHGVVHRDLKPGNVMLTQKGAKLLDFGIAKLRPAAVSEDAPTATASALTGEGLIVGTPQYMAPEQLEGKQVDARTDVFAFGVVLYEMVTGRKAFEAPSRAGLIAAILEREPAPLSKAQPAAPAVLETIVRRCLEKDPRRRYGRVDELLADLGRLSTDAAAAAPRKPRRPPARRTKVVAAIAGALCLAAAAASWLVRTWRDRSSTPARNFTFTQLTDQLGAELYPTLSPAGESLAYAAKSAGNWDIYFQRVGGKNPINLTQDSPTDDTQPVFSPDGQRIAFRSERSGGGIFLMGATGESVKRLTDFGYNPAWSPDGKEIVCSTSRFVRPDIGYLNPGSLFKVNVATGTKRSLTPAGLDAGGGHGPVQPHWSPQGHRIAYWGNRAGSRDIWTIPADGGEPVAVTNDPYVDWNPVWSADGGFIYFSSDRSGSMNLWRIPLDERSGKVLGPPEPITTPSTYSGYIGASRDGRRTAYVQQQRTVNIARIAFDPAREKVVGEPVPVTQGLRNVMSPQISPDGQWVAFFTIGTQEDIFVIRTDGTGLRQLTDDPDRDRGSRWSPDGKRIGFFSTRSGRFEIWSMNADGSGLQQLTDFGCSQGPHWSPDGARFACQRLPDLTPVVVASDPANRRVAQPLAPWGERSGRFVAGSWSPDGRSLTGTVMTPAGPSGIVVYTFESGQYQRLTGSGQSPSWLGDSRRLLFHHEGKLHLIDRHTKKIRQVVAIPPYEVDDFFSLSDDDRLIVFGLVDVQADVWMIEAQ